MDTTLSNARSRAGGTAHPASALRPTLRLWQLTASGIGIVIGAGIYVLVGDRPIRASRRSVQWCLDGIEQCWRSKSVGLKSEEVQACRAAYDHAQFDEHPTAGERDGD